MTEGPGGAVMQIPLGLNVCKAKRGCPWPWDGAGGGWAGSGARSWLWGRAENSLFGWHLVHLAVPYVGGGLPAPNAALLLSEPMSAHPVQPMQQGRGLTAQGCC